VQVVFWHKPSGFLIVSDLYWRYPREGTAWGTQAWKFGMDRIYAPFYRRFMISEQGVSPAYRFKFKTIRLNS
jgi:hypothetical protein